MSQINWPLVAIGFGIFFFGLRILSSIQSHTQATLYKPFLNHALFSPLRSLAVGFTATALLRASSTVILASTAWVNASIISFEQGFFLMLGATLGTTFQAWLIYSPTLLFPALFLTCGLLILFNKRPLLNEILDVLLALGLIHAGLLLVGQGFLPLQNDSFQWKLGPELDGLSLKTQALAIGFGVGAVLVFQSSSTVILWILIMASQGILPYESAVSMILGANLAAPVPVLWSALEFKGDGRRIIYSYLFIKVFAVFICWLTLPYFLALVDLLIPNTPKEAILLHLAGVHTLLNLLNVIWWGLLDRVILRIFRDIFKSDHEEGILAKTPVVWRMLASSPTLALKETDVLVMKTRLLIKSLFEVILGMLLNPGEEKDYHNQKINLARSYETYKSGIKFFVLHTSRHNLSSAQIRQNRSRLMDLADFDHFYRLCLALYDHIEREVQMEKYKIPAELLPHLDKIQRELNELWVLILSDRPREREKTMLISKSFRAMELIFFNSVSKNQSMDQAQLDWIFQSISQLRKLVEALLDYQEEEAEEEE